MAKLKSLCVDLISEGTDEVTRDKICSRCLPINRVETNGLCFHQNLVLSEQIWNGIVLGELVWLPGREKKEYCLCFGGGNRRWLKLLAFPGRVSFTVCTGCGRRLAALQ